MRGADHRLGDYGNALDNYLRSLAVSERAGKQGHIARLLNNIGNIHNSLGQYDEALEYFSRALELRKKAGSERDIATSLDDIGTAYTSLGRYDKALDYHTRSLENRERLGNRSDTAVSLNNIGNVYLSLGQYNRALSYYERTLVIDKETGDQVAMAFSLNNIGNVYNGLGQVGKALDCYTRAYAVLEKSDIHSATAKILNNIGDAQHFLGQCSKSLEYCKRSLAIQERSGSLSDIALSTMSLGNAHQCLGQYDKALDYFARSLALRERVGNQAGIGDSLHNIGTVYCSLRRYEEANGAYLRSMRIFEGLSLLVGDASEVGSFQSANQGSLYGRYSELQVKRGLPEEALALSERGRAQGLLRQSLLTEASLTAVLGPEDAKRLEAAQDAVAGAAKSMRETQQRLEGANENSRPLLEKAEAEQKAKLSEAESRYSLLKDSLLAKNEGFRDIVGRAEVSGSGQRLLQLGTRRPDTLFIEYSVVDDQALAFVLAGRGGLKVVEFSLPAKYLKKSVDDYLSAVQNSEVDELKLAKQLYTMLLGPLEKEKLLAGSFKHIAIVGEGPLLEIPFAALANEKGERLIERYSVSNLVSFSTLFWRITARDPKENMLSIADTTGQGGEVLRSATRGGFAPLPAARKEGIRAWRAFPDSKCLIGGECEESIIKEEMVKYSLLHFACHGTVNSKLPMRSALAMAPEKADSKDDGFLEAQEIVGLPLSAQMAVLSACHTGEGLQSGGEGLMGLAWAFRAAGVPAIVASKWEVDDAATGRMMATFYDELKKGARKDDALRTAMLSEMRYPQTSGKPRSATAVGGTTGKRSNAYYWAAFQVIGDPKPLDPLPKK